MLALSSCFRTAFAAASISTLAWIAPASAAVIYDGGAPDQGGQIFSQAGDNAAAMSFSLTSASDVTGANWWGGCFPATTCSSGPFTFTIYSNNSGVPGTVLDFAPIPNANETATGKLIGGANGWNEYSYNASVPSFALAANTEYWLVIQEVNAEPSGTWGWETTSSAPAGAQLVNTASCDPGTTWCALPQQLAFQLTGSEITAGVPEASTWTMLLLGFAGLGFLAHRRKNRGTAFRFE